MGPLSKYWKILRIDPGSDGCGYKQQGLPLAAEFFQTEFPELSESEVRSQPSAQQHRAIQFSLHAQFCRQAPSSELSNLAKAGLCLRCYVSYPILRACKKLANLYSATGQFTYQDLLPYVLNDDGSLQIVLDREGEVQRVLTQTGEIQNSDYRLFTVEVLQKFNPNAQPEANLDKWAYYQTRQNQDLKNFLSEQGLCLLSDWALLNRVRANVIEKFSDRDRALISAFHAVYRRDRRTHPHSRGKRCTDPTPAQLAEMSHWLQEKGLPNLSLEQLPHELKRIAKLLRQYDIWHRSGAPLTEPLEGTNPNTEGYRELPDPKESNTLDQVALQELKTFCRQQLVTCLDSAIKQGLEEHIHHLSQRRNYASLASKVIPALQLIYCQGKSQGEIAPVLGMNNQTQVSRVLNLKTLLSQVRTRTVAKFLRALSAQVDTLDSNRLSTDPDYSSNLMHQLELFVDTEVFQAAAAEIRTSKNRSLESIYAQRLRRYILQHKRS